MPDAEEEKTPPVIHEEQPTESNEDTPVAEETAKEKPPTLNDKIIVMDKPSARDALQQLSGSWAASIASRLLDDSRFIREAALHHAFANPWQDASAPPAAGTTRAWHQAWFSSARRQDWQGTPGDTRDTGGLVLGGTYSPSSTLDLSGYLGVQQSRMWRSQHSNHASINTKHLGVALAHRWQNMQWILGAAHSWHTIQSKRELTAPGLYDKLQARYHGRTLQLFTELSAPPLYDIAPFTRFAWIRQHTSGYNEQGGLAALNVEPARHDAQIYTLGLKAQHTLHTKHGPAQLQGELAWHHASGDVHTNSHQYFRNSTKQTLFMSEGQALARNAWSVQLGVEAKLGKHGQLGFGYAGQYASGQQDHGARVNAGWVF